ncbi:MAG: glycosyltransferase [Acidimicrobiia bacterium]
MGQRTDQTWAAARQRYGPRDEVALFDGDPRLALVTVNFSTTRYLKLMLCTLGEQRELWFLRRLVIVDNHSRDGGLPFLRALAARVPRVHLVERRHALHHAGGMRAGVRALTELERDEPADARANVVVFCDTDVVFRNPATLLDLSAALVTKDGAFVGEARQAPPRPHPDVQASFFAVRRDAMARRDVRPLEHHGSPAFAMQWSMLRAGLTVVDFPSNHGGYVLHRGRAGVEAAAAYSVGAHARVPAARSEPHYMGVPDGPTIWAGIEAQWAPLLAPEAEPALLEHLAERFAVIGDDVGA